MARTRGGGVISGVSTRPRRNMGKTKPNDAAATQGSYATPCSAGGPGIESMKQQPPGKARCGRRTSERRGASPSPTPDSVSVEPGRGRKILRRAGQTFTATASVSEGARTLRGQDHQQQQDGSLQGLLDGVESGARAGELGEVQVSGLRMMSSPQGSPPGETTCQSQARSPETRSGPTPSKLDVWRMLYVDPDVADPKLVAGRLEVAASMILRCGCVFDVATDIVQALADVRGDTMSLYRAVFVNETLQRHKKSVQSIEGKHLAQFFRQAGMSAARIVLLVGGDVQFDTVDAGAHGLSAVLRKPFTRDGFCDVLRGMYLSGEPEPEGDAEKPTSASEEVSKAEHQPTKSTNTSSPCTTCGSTPSPCPPCNSSVYPTLAALPMTSKMTLPLDCSTGSAAAAAMAAAAAARAATVQTGGGVLGPTPAGFPDCLGFTPFPPAMIEQLRRYPIVAGFPRPGPPVMMPRRKYTKIAPREEDESAVAAGTVAAAAAAVAAAAVAAAAAGSQNTPSESGSLETISDAPTAPGDQNLEGLSRDGEEQSEGSTRRCD